MKKFQPLERTFTNISNPNFHVLILWVFISTVYTRYLYEKYIDRSNYNIIEFSTWLETVPWNKTIFLRSY